jgi:copper resistance protein D
VLDALAALTKALLYAAALPAAGFALALASLPLSPPAAAYALRGARLASIATIVASCAVAALLIARLGGELDPVLLSAVFGSSVGAALALQLSGAILLLTSAGDDGFARAWRASSAFIITLSFAFSGHAAAMSPQASLLAGVHVTAASWWLASLWLLRRTCCVHEPTTASLVTGFSRIALAIVGGLVLAGVLLALSLVTFDEPGWFDQYEWWLLVKIAFAACALGAAAINRLRTAPEIEQGDVAAFVRLRRLIDVELVAIVAVLITTAILTTYFSPHTDPDAGGFS